ncbi:MAG: WHG domain-containing protein [Candidatus Sphingomonas colombiensis]|nr:WHG domain-containing protein [Sphingomonas sp.]WEK42110.1 MAG: WHG domain-containing protein [Sphingomonas sp.]
MAAKSGANAGEKPKKPYHHGALREALLESAEHILERDGITGLTLRAAAREAGASHAAPKNHFDDMTGLLSELAARGLARFTDSLLAAADRETDATARLNAIGRAYVEFALANPGLFQLMFRSERLDHSRLALAHETRRSLQMLADAVGAAHPTAGRAEVARAWTMVHGFAMLVLDGRLKSLMGDDPDGSDPMALLDTMLALD